MKTEDLYSIYLAHPSIQTDTRKLQPGDLFFALKGPSFNGNLFAEKALELGASYAIVDENIAPENRKVIVVNDVLSTLHELAKFHRETFDIPFIGITGSNGKTTTKELIHAVLSTQFKTYYTKGNLNNHIGVPLTILSIKKNAEIAIIEMGANHQKEIEGYCKYAEPTFGIITNCGKAHLEGFGGVEGVRKGKGELFDFIRAHDGAIFAFFDYDYFHSMSHDIKEVHWYGTKNGEITGTATESDPFLQVKIRTGFDNELEINTQLVGDYNLPNVLCAVSVGKKFGIAPEKIKAGIEAYVPSNSRSQLLAKGSNKIILDAYNANPSSMKAAIENFAAIKGSKKVLLLGAMMELGKESIAEHEALLALVKKFTWEKVVFVGGDFGKINVSPFIYFDNSDKAAQWFVSQKFEDTEILIKGSNSIHMGKIVE